MNNPKSNIKKPALDFREGMEKGTAQARDNYEKIGAAAEPIKVGVAKALNHAA